jgi:hypothetical protein
MRLEARLDAAVVHALKPQERVLIVGETDDMLEVETLRWRPSLRGYVPRSAVIRRLALPPVFPRLKLNGGLALPSVPGSLPLASFLPWLETEDESPWIPADYATAIREKRTPSVGSQIRLAIARHRAAWDAWIAEAQAQDRLKSATMEELIVLLRGGRDMWSIRAERIFTDPSQHSATIGWAVPEDVLRWTGRVRVNEKEPKYTTWYEVELTKSDTQLRGWYKAGLLHEFFAPAAGTDLAVEENRATVFDLGRPRLRLPIDPEIEDSRSSGRAAEQFIDLRRLLGRGLLHHNLCGEFCAAALAACDVIPALESWLASYPRAHEILMNDGGTSIPDLQALLGALGLKYEFYRSVGSVSPVTPVYVRSRLDTGAMAIVFTGVTTYGTVSSRGRTRHWVVVEDALCVGSSAWLRVYNPFTNREETYRFEEVFDTPARDSIGLWVEPRSIVNAAGLAAERDALPKMVAESVPVAFSG